MSAFKKIQLIILGFAVAGLLTFCNPQKLVENKNRDSVSLGSKTFLGDSLNLNKDDSLKKGTYGYDLNFIRKH